MLKKSYELLDQLCRHLRAALQRTPPTASSIGEIMDLVHRVAQVLDAPRSASRTVRHKFDRLVEEIRQKQKRSRSALKKASLSHMGKTARIFRPGLFEHYDHPDLPPTNNEHEGMFRQMRGYERRIPGHKSTARRTARDGTLLATAQQRVARKPIAGADLARMATSPWRKSLEQYRQQRQRYDRPRTLRRNLGKVLRSIRQRIRKLDRHPARAP